MFAEWGPGPVSAVDAGMMSRPGSETAAAGAGPWAGRLAAIVAAAVVFVVALASYVPTVLKDVGTWDVAEFQTVSYVLGIAHPTGYPTYTLLGKLWLVLNPFGSVAWRMNLLSAVAASGAAGLLAGLSTRWAGPFLGVVAGLTFAFAPFYWRVALRADPHALNALVMVGIVALALAWEVRRDFRLLAALALLAGIGLGNHMLVVMLAPAVGLLILTSLPDRQITWKRLAILTGMFALGLSVFLYLPLRAAMNPPLNYAHPTTPERFFYLVSGAQFHGAMGFLSASGLANFWAKLQQYPAYLATWYTVPGAAAIGGLGVTGFVWLLVRRWRAALFLLLAYLVPFYAASNYQNADLDRYHFGPHAVLILLAAAGFGVLARAWGRFLDHRTRQERLRGSGWGSRGQSVFWRLLPRPAVVALALQVLPVMQWRDAQPRMMAEGQDTYGRRYLEAMHRSTPQDAVILSWWSMSTTLWYGRWVEGKRPDFSIIDHRNLFDDGWDADFLKVAKAYVGKRPVITNYLDHDLATLRNAGYVLEPFMDPQLGQLGWFVTKPGTGSAAPAPPPSMVGSS